ncbi:hypothetical protein [Burkholderia sp. ABCPW 11]|uniref:hypothetical protein n=1 Tax=Burkholderia sp. ABCPW 11 TaxID=1637859 RepID=UPI0012FD2226|nr:hypothetical protein [Burkholderia sp. ABCPW 11]
MHLSTHAPRIFIAPDHGSRRWPVGKNGWHLRACDYNGSDWILTYYVSCAMKLAMNGAKRGNRPTAVAGAKESGMKNGDRSRRVHDAKAPATPRAAGHLEHAVRNGDASRG